MQSFTEQDLTILDEFGKLVNDKATFDLSTADAVKLVKCLNGINQIRKKVSDNILEYRSIMQANQDALNNTLSTPSGE